MAKISEMTDGDLVKYIKAYEKKVESGVDLEKSNRLLNGLKKEQVKRRSSGKPVKPVKPVKAVEVHHSSDIDYSDYDDAKFGSRAIALFIDSVILGITNQILIAAITAVGKSAMPAEFKLISMIVPIITIISLPTAYAIYFLRKNGQTIGKKIMKIKVIDNDGSDQLSIKAILLREVLGKVLSTVIFYLGFIVVLFGKKSWHDSIAGTKVIKVE